MAGDIPYVQRGLQTDYKEIYYSNPDAALKVPITIMAGFGVLPVGTALATNGASGGRPGQLMPYDPAAVPDGVTYAPGRINLVSDSGTTSSTFYVGMDDSYKLAVNDEIYIRDNTTAAMSLGRISAIDRTTYSHMAKITTTVATGGTSYTVARFAYLAHKGYDTCTGILEKAVDTGYGSTAKGAVATSVISNAVLYNGMLTNVDSSARTDISATVVGQYLVIK